MATSMRGNVIIFFPSRSKEQLLAGRIETIKNEIYENCDIKYIDELLDLLIEYSSALDDDTVENVFQQKLEEAAYWWGEIRGD